MKKGVLIPIIFLFIINLSSLISAEKIGINIENNFLEGGDVDFKITLYDDANIPMDGMIDFVIKNTYSDIIHQGQITSGEKINFEIPTNSQKGTWEITASYADVNARENFIVDEIKKVDIKLEEDNLVVTNI